MSVTHVVRQAVGGYVKSAVLIALLGVLCSACSERGIGYPEVVPVPAGMVISNPTVLQSGVVTSNPSSASVVYISLEPGTEPNASSVRIVNRTLSSKASVVAVLDGGFDPVPIVAQADDILDMVFVLTTGGEHPVSVKVPARKPPTVVRTNPGKGRVDVALNVSISIVFSEPIDSKTITLGSIRVVRNGFAVPGVLSLDDNSITAHFVPASVLDAQTLYDLSVTPDVKDLDGDPLEAPYSSSFTTCPGYAIPNACPPFPTGGPFAVRGTVLERTLSGTQPMSAFVWAWVQRATNGYSAGRRTAGSDGKFEFDIIPDALIILTSLAKGYDQPCAAKVIVQGADATVNVELVSEKNPIPDALTALPLLKGVVYEDTPEGRRPVAGAKVGFDATGGLELYAATTTTDANGRYAMCGLQPVVPTPTVVVSAAGFAAAEQQISISVGVTTLDIPLHR